MSGRAEKDALFEAIALMGKAFASPRRLELLDLLAQAPRTVDELAKASEQSMANTSQHLQALHAAGMVTRAREGTSVRYALAGHEALSVWLALRDASVARLAEVERAAREYLGEDVEAIGREELIERLRRGDVVLVDVRPDEEFAAGHIEGARSIPLDELGNGWRSCRPTARSWRIAAARSARTRTRRSGSCGQKAAPPDVWRRAGRSGDSPASLRFPPESRDPTGGRHARHRMPVRTPLRSRRRLRRRHGRMSPTDTPVDVNVLRDEIRKTYTDVSTDAERDFIFPTGRAWAQDLGYPQPELSRVPDATVESFAGVANHWPLGRIEPGSAVLDLGCGAGTDLLIAAQMTGPDGRVIGVDMTPAMLKRAHASAQQMGLANVELHESLIEALPLEDAAWTS